MTCEGPRDLSCQNIVKKRKSLSVDILCRAPTPCRRIGPSLACPDVSDETPERDGDIGSILDSRCRQISRTWMLQQLLFSNEHKSWLALKLRRVFAQHFLSFGVFSWLVKRAHSCKHRVWWKWYLGKDGLLYQSSGNMSYLGKTSMKKKTFSFGHCPNEGGGGGLARIKKYTLYIPL